MTLCVVMASSKILVHYPEALMNGVSNDWSSLILSLPENMPNQTGTWLCH